MSFLVILVLNCFWQLCSLDVGTRKLTKCGNIEQHKECWFLGIFGNYIQPYFAVGVQEIAWHRVDELPVASNEPQSHQRGPTGLKYFMVFPFVTYVHFT